MKIQLAYRVTGENREGVINNLKEIVTALEKHYEVYCPILDSNQPKDKKEMFLDTLNKMKNADIVLALIRSDDKSEGMLMEVGHALGLGKKLVLVVKKGINNTHLRLLASTIIEFDNIDDLSTKLVKLRL